MSQIPIPQDPLSRFAIAIFRINGALLRNGDRLAKESGQTSARWQVLGRAGNKPQTVAQIARSLGHARQSVQRIADTLTKDGLIAYQPNPADKRAQLLSVTPAGKNVMASLHARNMVWAEHALTKLDKQQFTALASQLEQTAKILETDE